MSEDRSTELQQRILTAIDDREMLKIVGGNSKAFYGNASPGEVIETRIHHGIIHYNPTELVITARAGTSLKDIEAALAKHNQFLPFEPPHFGEHATLGGAIATGLSGPRRPYTGSVRDFVLGVKIISGKGDIMHFGGEVIKNVAGYDVSRLMVGALGTLGMLLEVSLKVIPKPACEKTQVLSVSKSDAFKLLNEYSTQPLPLSAAAYTDEQLYLRMSGAQSAVTSAQQKVGGQEMIRDDHFWEQLREQQHVFFKADKPLWRVSVPLGTDIGIKEDSFIDWAGAQHWFYSDESADTIQQLASHHGGHATLFKGDTDINHFQALSSKLRQIHLNLKMKFDPYGILNFNRLYQDL